MTVTSKQDNAAPSSRPWTNRDWHKFFTSLLLVIFCVTSAVAVIPIWARIQIQNTDRYVNTVEPLASDPAIQTGVTARITERLTSRVDQTFTGSRLPSSLSFLAAPLTSTLDQWIGEQVNSIVTSDQFPTFWEAANRAAHPKVSALLTGEGGKNVSTADGTVTLDLSAVFTAVKEVLNQRGVDLFNNVQFSNEDMSIVIFKSEDLAKIQGIVNHVDTLAVLLPILALASLAGYLWRTPNRRRGVIWAGLGLAAAMAILLVLLAWARSRYLDGLGSDVQRNSAAAFFDTVGRNMRLGVRLLAAIGLAVAAVAAATAPNGWLNRYRAARRRNAVRPRRWSWFSVSWLEQHQTGLLAGLIVCFCLAVVAWSYVPTTWAGTISLLAAAALLGLWWLSRSATHRQMAIATGPGAAIGSYVGQSGLKSVVGDNLGVAPARATTEAAVADIARDLSTDDLIVLQRVATAMRDSGRTTETKFSSS